MLRSAGPAVGGMLLLACGGSTPDLATTHTITLDSIVSLGYNAGPYSPTMKSEVVWLPNAYIISNTYVPGELAVLDEAGRLLKTLGRKGEGPGEFERIDAIAADTLRRYIYALDSRNGRITTFDFTGAVISETSIRLFANQIEVLPTAGFLVHPLRDRATEGLPGTVIKGDSVFDVGYDDRTFRNNARLAAGPDGGIWISRFNRYEITKYSEDGRRLQTIRRSADWFHEFDPARLARRGGTATTLEDIALDSEGRLWVLISQVHITPEMLSRETSGPGGGERRPEPPSVAKQFTHSRLEVLDPISGALIASHEAPDHLFRGFIDAGRVYALVDDVNGVLSAQVWRIVLNRRSQRVGND